MTLFYGHGFHFTLDLWQGVKVQGTSYVQDSAEGIAHGHGWLGRTSIPSGGVQIL